MSHPYKQYAADKVGKARAKQYQSGGGLPLGAGRRGPEKFMEYNQRIEPIPMPTASQEVDEILRRQKESNRPSITRR